MLEHIQNLQSRLLSRLTRVATQATKVATQATIVTTHATRVYWDSIGIMAFLRPDFLNTCELGAMFERNMATSEGEGLHIACLPFY